MTLPHGFRVIEPGEEPTGKADRAAPRELKTVWADEIELDIDKPGLIDGLLSTTGMTVIYGESGAGKSFITLDIACHVAAGLPWYGLEVEQGIVVYIAAESPKSIERRIWAWKRKHQVEHLPVLVVQSSVDLLNGDADALAALLERVKREPGRIALVAVDTLARAMTGNENSPEDMGKFVASCDRLREAGECHVIVVHHCGKDMARGARGHSCLRAATDVEGEVTKGGDGRRVLTIKKNRDGEEGAAYAFRLEAVELGENDKGRVVTTCVTVACDPPDRATGKEKRPLGPNEKIVFEALTASLSDHGQAPPPARDIPQNVKVVPVERWREAAFRYLPQAETKRKGEAFNRATASLVAYGRVRHANGHAWLPEGRTGRIGSHEAACDPVRPVRPSGSQA